MNILKNLSRYNKENYLLHRMLHYPAYINSMDLSSNIVMLAYENVRREK